MSRRNNTLAVIAGLTAGTAAALAYLLKVRPWIRTWGATPAEVARTYPGDERVPNPKLDLTHAITIQAPPEKIWPWLIQLGQGRAGMYSYDWIENLMGLDIHTRPQVLNEFQTLKAGDTVPLEPGGIGPVVAEMEPNRYLLLASDSAERSGLDPSGQTPYADMFLTWLFYLEPLHKDATRLIERVRVQWLPGFPADLDLYLFWEPGSFLMERKMLLKIKELAEKPA